MSAIGVRACACCTGNLSARSRNALSPNATLADCVEDHPRRARRINENDDGSGTGLQRIGGELSGDDHQEGHRRAGYSAAWLRAVQADDRRVRSAEPCSSTRAPVHPRSCAGASMSCPRCRQYPRTFLRMTRRVCRMVVLATQWPATRVRPGPHPKRTRVVIPSAC